MWVIAKPHKPIYKERNYLDIWGIYPSYVPEDQSKWPFYPRINTSRGRLVPPTKLDWPPGRGAFTATVLSGRSIPVRVPYGSPQDPFYNRGKHTVYISAIPSVFLLISSFKYKRVAEILSKATADNSLYKWWIWTVYTRPRSARLSDTGAF